MHFATIAVNGSSVAAVRLSDGSILEIAKAASSLSDEAALSLREGTLQAIIEGGAATVAFNSGEMSAYSSSTADSAILNQRGMKVRDITPPEFARFFGNGIATMGDTIRDDRELVEKFGRAFIKGHAFALDDANREAVMAHLKAGNRQEGEDPEFQGALFDAVRSKTIPVDMTNGLGYLPPEIWEGWQASLIAGAEIEKPLDDLTAAYTNDFIAGWNEAIK